MRFPTLQLPPAAQDVGLLILRVFFGFCMIYGHGWGKLTRLLGAEEIRFADPFGLGPAFSLGLAAFAEVFCAFLVMLGLFTRIATIPLIVTMVTAFFVAHLNDPFGQQEKVILFGAAYLALFFTGAGKYSIDAQLGKR
ncbi:MAG TPA: DoxX family protein [Cyclobacteriaceae bacterium]|nr:DoxX family protein [Cyclobacteriaceae bacterium]